MNERPFEAALRTTYRIGIECGVPWLMTLDADVLLREGAVGELLARAQRLAEPFVQIEGLVHDRFIGDYRSAGHRIYRTRYLEKALAEVPGDGAEIRPEHATLLRLEALGHPSAACDLIVGTHDYEQYFADIYRKSFVHGQKHPAWLSSVIPWWRSLADADPDFRVALRGYFDGFLSPARARIDARDQVDSGRLTLGGLGLEEKPVLSMTAGLPEELRVLQERLAADTLPKSPASRHVRVREAYERMGAFRFIPYAIGSALGKLGERLRRGGEG